MSSSGTSILLIGESGVGKTHYGAQLLKRLMKGGDSLRMHGAATNLEPFEAALESLNDGRAADHTATGIYLDSEWPISDASGRTAVLVWPEYGGEQIKNIVDSRRIPSAWRARIETADVWLLLVRLQQARVSDDIFSRPLSDLQGTSIENRDVQTSDQARLIELLQMLVFAAGPYDRPIHAPRLQVLLTCWDESAFEGTPAAALADRFPIVSSFVRSNWSDPVIMGLSALERPLNPTNRDNEYVTRGPEQFGYVILPDGKRSPDVTMPIAAMLV